IEENDTLESLSQKIHVQEHELYPEVLQLISEERIQIKGRKILIQKKA
ncbi:MAG: phosphoribosylglycinamide formyltransferase, partial [Deltaproteobacteria bacterium]|nr:phosphoribosylglycinamide formyltransferase [Deltaproteobacteria bacterium]